MRALFINPPTFGELNFSREGRCMQRRDFWSFNWPPLTLALCASIAQRAGWEAHLLDGSADSQPAARDQAAFLETLKRIQPDLIVCNTGTPSIDSDLAIAPLIKSALPNSRLGYLGIHASYFDQEILGANPEIDFILRGEPEFTVEALCKNDGDPTGVQGITHRVGAECVRQPNRPFSTDLSGLPTPAWDLINTADYRLPNNGQPVLMVSTVRGCPYLCTYCHTQEFYGNRIRSRSPRVIAEEIAEASARYGVDHFLLWSELFTAEPDWVIEFCEALLDTKVAVQWAASSRADRVNDGMLALMKRAGCWLMAFGIESGNQEVLDRNKKKTTPQHSLEGIRAAKEAGIETAGHFVFGLPGETDQSAMETISFAVQSGLDYAQFYCAVPFPGSELYEQAKRNGWLVTGAPWSDYDQSRSVLSYPDGLSAAEIEQWRKTAYRKFYFRPRMAIRALGRIKSFEQIKQMSRIAANFL